MPIEAGGPEFHGLVTVRKSTPEELEEIAGGGSRPINPFDPPRPIDFDVAPAGHTVQINGQADGKALVTVGGQELSGELRLYGPDERPRVVIGGANSDIRLSDQDGQTSVIIDGAAGDIVLPNADVAEEFRASPGLHPGMVAVLDDHGELAVSQTAYDRRVAGVVSGAGQERPGIILGRRASTPSPKPIALVGRVYCLVDAEQEPVGVGDLLTTSDTPGHAMVATSRDRAFGAVLGKALAPLPSSRGLLPILVALQ